MKLRRLINILGILILLVLALLGIAHDNSVAVAQTGIDKIEPTLVDQFSTQGTADFIVQFSEQADLTAAYSMDWDARGEYVYNTLRDTAAKSQANAIALLEKAGVKYETFIAGNELYIWGGTLEQADKLAGLSEVNSIEATRTYSIDPVQVVKPLENITWAGDLLAKHALTTVTSSAQASVDWGITDTKADAFWANYGVRGDGIVVASIDTGVQWNHPALDQAYKCASNPSSSACWKDPTNIPCGSPCDNNGHGTHTMGTMVGDDDPSLSYIVGMAPNAKWIACRGCEGDTCTAASLLACADWILAPGGSPANRPNVVNNSWGGGSGLDWYLSKVNAWRAAGIFPAFSAGNATGCDNLTSPGDYQSSFASTGHDATRAHWFSQGPSAFGDTPYTKPNLSAPAVNICSSIPTNSWSCGYSGTSMASPHTAGAVALLWSCNPSLVGQIDATFQLLQKNTDRPSPVNPVCLAPAGGEGTYEDGYGYLNVLAAGGIACGSAQGEWTQIGLPSGCPDLTRYDAEFYPATGKVYLLGGRSGTNTDGTIYAYNPATNTCTTTGRSMPTPVSNYTIAVVNKNSVNLLCTFGGRDSAGNSSAAVQCYNPTANSVTTISSLPASLAPFTPGGVAVVNNKAYVFGGIRLSQAAYNTAQTWEWNPVSNTWSQKGNLSLARGYINTAVVDGKIYAFGGDVYDGANLVSQTVAEVFDPVIGSWNDGNVADLPTANGEGTAYGFNIGGPFEYEGKIIIAGGGQFPYETADAFMYDVSSNSYDYAFPNLNISRRDQAGFMIPGSKSAIWVFGGRTSSPGYGVDSPPYASPEYYALTWNGYLIHIPIVIK